MDRRSSEARGARPSPLSCWQRCGPVSGPGSVGHQVRDFVVTSSEWCCDRSGKRVGQRQVMRHHSGHYPVAASCRNRRRYRHPREQSQLTREHWVREYGSRCSYCFHTPNVYENRFCNAYNDHLCSGHAIRIDVISFGVLALMSLASCPNPTGVRCSGASPAPH